MPNWGQGFQGAAGGAMAGGAIGGLPGAAIGGGLGFLGGLFGGGSDTGQYQDQLKKLSEGYGRRTAPQGTAQTAGPSSLVRNRAGLIAQLEAMARGEGPSAAQLQMNQAMDRAQSSQASAAAGAGGRGVNAGGALRMAMNNTAAIQSKGAQDAAILRAQEQANAMGQLGSVVGQGINADQTLSSFNAQQQNYMTQANMEAALKQLGLNDEAQLRALLGAMGVEAGKPNMGSAILAGGASAVPGLLQYGLQKKQMGMGMQPQGGFSPGPYTPGSWNGYPGVPDRTGMI
jgi:hypothetical protein